MMMMIVMKATTPPTMPIINESILFGILLDCFGSDDGVGVCLDFCLVFDLVVWSSL